MTLERIDPDEVARRRRLPTPDEDVREGAASIVQEVRDHGEPAIRRLAERFGEVDAGGALVLDREAMRAALSSLEASQREVLERTAARIDAFARAQRAMFAPVSAPVPGGRAGHEVLPVASAGCYAPGGRYPLPSSVLMTAVTARAAGVDRVVVASPNPTPAMLAAGAIADADAYLRVGGAHAIAALAYGFEGFEPVDVVVGPGNAWVTAAKRLVVGVVGIDMLAGPSELLVLADGSADPAAVAADLLAQAEHDADASAMLVTTSAALADAVDGELARQLDSLATRDTARAGLANGFCCVVGSVGEAVAIADLVAPEHLEVCTRQPDAVAAQVRNAGGVFIGSGSAEVFGDYGFGPNHTLPTGGTARFQGGLSVASFLRLRTWLRVDHPDAATQAMADAAALARLEGLAGHEASARVRLGDGDGGGAGG